MSSYSDDDIEGIVFDIGTHRARVGFSGEDCPKVHTPYWTVPEFRDKYFEEFRLFDPQKFDTETVDEVIEKSLKWADIDNELIKRCSVMFTEHLHRSESEREKLMELIFEKYQCAAFYIAPSPILSMYSSGRGTGIIFECGNSFTETAVIYESDLLGYSRNLHQVNGRSFDGSELSLRLKSCLNDDNCFVDDADIIALKEKYFTFTDEVPEKLLLPDGKEIETNRRLFQDQLLAENDLSSFIYTCVMGSSVHCRRDIFASVILSGGTTLTQGLPKALKKGITDILNKRHRRARCNVVACPERSYSPWIGGSILSSLSCFMNTLNVSKQMYEESGDIRVQQFFINPEKMELD